MSSRVKTNRKSKSSSSRNRRVVSKQANGFNFETLEPRHMLAAVTVTNLTDSTNAPDTSSIAALMADDGGDGISLREALDAANSNLDADKINFSPGLVGGTLVLTQGQLSITSDIEIDGDAVGDDMADITISGNDVSRVILVTGDAMDVSLKALHITAGTASNGGGVLQSPFSSTLTIANSIISNNHADFGGGIYTRGTLNVTDSTLSENTATGFGGGIRVALGHATINSSTLSGNTAGYAGGAINVYGESSAILINTTVVDNQALSGGGVAVYESRLRPPGTLTLTNSTVTGNRATGEGSSGSGGGIRNDGDPTSVTLTNTIVIGNEATEDMEISGPYINGGGNVTNAVPSAVFGDVSPSGVPLLTDNGGPVLTIGLRASRGNPALDTGFLPAGIATDAHGNFRDFDITAINNGGAVDAGAVELQQQSESSSLVVTTAADVSNPFDNETSLREAVTFANSVSDQSEITFDVSLAGQTFILTQGQIQISSDLTIEGDVIGNDDLADITISGNDASRVFLNFGEASLNSLRIRNGSAFDGGGIYNAGTLTLNNSTLSENVASVSGGGIRNTGTLTLNNSTLSGNSSGGGGGGIFNISGDVSLFNSTFSGNNSDGGGGGIYNLNGDIFLINSTLTGNSTSGGVGGGIFIPDSTFDSSLTVGNSIVAGNAAGTANDLVFASAGVLTINHSLIGVADGLAVTGGGNVTGTTAAPLDPLLGPLADNGGPTLTHALLQNSPAIDAGDDFLAVDQNGVALDNDQRGEVRIQFDSVDIGAVESAFGDSFVLGDASLDGVVNFSDIPAFISLLSANVFLDEADIDRNGVVNFIDIAPFIDLLATGGSARSNEVANNLVKPKFSNGSAVTSQAIVTAPPFSSTASVVVVAEPELPDSVASTNEVLIKKGKFGAKNVDTGPAVFNLSFTDTSSLPKAPLVSVSDSMAVPATQARQLLVVGPTLDGTKSIDTFSGPVEFPAIEYSFFRAYTSSSRGLEKGFESNELLAKQHYLKQNSERVDVSDKSRQQDPTGHVLVEKTFSEAAELFDAHPETLDEVFDFETEESFAGLI